MGMGKAPKPVKVPEPPPIEEDVDPEVRAARDRSRQRAAALGRKQTLLTPGGAGGISGMGGASVGGRTVLGG